MIIKHALFCSRFTRLLAGILLLIILRPALAGSQTILVLGDSISAAYGMSLEQGWVALMGRELGNTHPDYTIVNASISGETTAGALQRLPALLEKHQPNFLIIELGGNDGLRGYPIITLRANLLGMVEQAREINAKVILVPMEIPPNYGNRYTEGFRESYVVVADNTNSTLAPFLLAGVATDPKLMQADGIHPTVEAQPLLMNNFLPTLLEVMQ
ncbi:MAG: arylesterase [Halioglobus sp.]